MKLGEKLKQYRESKNWTQPQAAEAIGIEQSYLSKLENDHSLPSIEIFRRIVSAYETNVADIMEDIDPGSYEHLTQITDVADFLSAERLARKQGAARRTSRQTLAVAVGAGLIYAGLSDMVFPLAETNGDDWKNQVLTFLGIVALTQGFIGLLVTAKKQEISDGAKR